MAGKSFGDYLEILSLLLIEENFSEKKACAELNSLLGELQICMPDLSDHLALGAIVQARSLAKAMLEGASKDPDQDLQLIGEKISFLQAHNAGDEVAQSEKSDDTTFALPDWVDVAIFEEFVAAQKLNLEELETEIFALEREEPDALAAIKRRVHTLKGESGVLGLDDLSHVCHGIEDYVAEVSQVEEQVEALFQLKDWIEAALKSYVGGKLPEPSGAELIANFSKKSAEKSEEKAEELNLQAAKKQAAKPEAERAQEEQSAEHDLAAAVVDAELQAAQRDEETVALIAEFLTEGQDGLNLVDEILIAGEQNGIDADQINAMFRVFHTTKGVSSFLDFHQVTSLAHKTETLLNLAREGTLILADAALDVVFDATSMLRELLDKIFIAVEAGTVVPEVEGHAALIKRLGLVIDGDEPVPAVKQGTSSKVEAPSSASPPQKSADSAEDRTVPHVELGPHIELGQQTKSAAQEVAAKPAEPIKASVSSGLKPKRSATKIRETVKVDLERVESLVEMIGELVIVESMVVHSPEIKSSASVMVRDYLSQLTKITRDLQDIGMRMRMVPVRGVFQKMARMVRDLARKKDKNIKFILSGEGTEMDRSLVEQIADPLVHMIRNAVDHGVEDEDVRMAAGKDPVGHIELSAFHQGGNIVIKVADDGGGLDKDALLKKAIEKGIVQPGDNLSDSEIHNLIFAPGFSTAKVVSEISGRGVGMDVVRRNIKAMRGRVSIESSPGEGSVFQLMLPLTTAIIDGMLIRCADENFIIPTLSIVEAVQPSADMLHSMAGRGELMTLRGEALPLIRLDRILGIPAAKQNATEALVVVVESIGQRFGILVDDVVTQQQVVIKSLSGEVKEIKYISGAAILSDGHVGLILNIDEMGSLAEQGALEISKAKTEAVLQALQTVADNGDKEHIQ